LFAHPTKHRCGNNIPFSRSKNIGEQIQDRFDSQVRLFLTKATVFDRRFLVCQPSGFGKYISNNVSNVFPGFQTIFPAFKHVS
jgi:hypothetical protein